MKASFFTALTAFAASAIASPVPVPANNGPKVMNMARSVFERSSLAKYDRMVRDAEVKRGNAITDSVNYILVLQKDSSNGADAYQDEIDAANAKDILGKRSNAITDSVNYILVLQKDSSNGADAYQDEIDAANAKDILGKRDINPITDSVNYILVLQKDSSNGADAYQDEIDAANAKDILG